MSDYTRQYIKQALMDGHTLEPPDPTRTDAYEVLDVLYHATDKPQAWFQILNLRPEMKRYTSESKLILADDLKNITQPEYMLTEYPVYRFGLNALVGASGSGKSFLALDIAARVAEKVKVVYLAAEGLHGYSSRWEAWKQHYGVAENKNLLFYPEPVDFLSEIQTEQFIAAMDEIKPRLIVVDTLARCMVGDENSTRDMSQFVASVDTVKRKLDAGLLVVHHTGKDGKMRGNTALRGACDSIIILNSLGDGKVVAHNTHAEGGKNKHAPEYEPRYMTLLPVAESAVLVTSDKVVKPEKNMPTTSWINSTRREILQALAKTALPASEIVTITGLAKSTVFRNLKFLMEREAIDADNELYYLTSYGKESL